MNVAKNWALTIMLIALAFAHCSSELLFKEQIIIPVKKMLNNAGHIDAKLIEIQGNRLFFIDCFLAKFPSEISREIGRFFREFAPENPSKFDFLPLNPSEIGLFFLRISTCFPRENPAKSADFFANLPPKIPRNFAFFSAKYQKPCLYG